MEQGGGRGRKEGEHLCQVPVSSWVCMHAMTHQESFFQGAGFHFSCPQSMLKDHTYVFNEVTDNHRKTDPATAGGFCHPEAI